MAAWDAIVVGAGAGGMFAAARLAHAGYRTLVVERAGKVGGRASTSVIDGFLVNEGAIVIEVGGATEATFAEVGAEFDVRRPSVPVHYRVAAEDAAGAHRDLDAARGGWGLLLSSLTDDADGLLAAIAAARRDDAALPDAARSTAEWVAEFTTDPGVHGLVRNLCASVFAVGSAELPARVFLTYFTRKSAFKEFGFCPAGTIGIWESLARAVTDRGGEVWLSSTVEGLHLDGGLVTGATVLREGKRVEVACRVAVSDAGPAATLDLIGPEHLPAGYREQVRAGDRPCAMLVVNFASERPLLDVPGLLVLTRSRRLCYLANLTATCPEMAPPGWHLYAAASVPEPAVGDFDEAAELDLLLADLRDHVPGFDAHARILSTPVFRDRWPPQRAVAGHDLSHTTPLPNLFNVGDAVKEYASGGTTACAETARLVVARILEEIPSAP